MTRLAAAALSTALSLGAALGCAGAAQACDGAGVIVRIDGQPQDVVITRAAQVVSRPRVLEVVCRADVIKSVGATRIVLSIDGVGNVTVTRDGAYTVPARSGAPSALGNAYRSINDEVMPDMKRMPWNVRLKGAGDDFGFALPALTAGGQHVSAGDRSLLVRLVGGSAPYKVEIRNGAGAIVASQTSESHEVRLDHVPLSLGDYKITASDSTPRSLDAAVSVVSASPPADDAFAGLTDPEIRAAASATALARSQTATWSFEAEQQLAAAPANGLDRDKVYELIESYSAD
ncbi:MAG TPA: hypothetical protein VMT68_12510 [Caulobacteraceae bacterium]|nr:hypothetical protein [Caulobacteraceae bacterium]